MRQRVMIAVALACSPKVLIADEPTTALDVTIQAQIMDLIVEMNHKFDMGVMLITHDLAVVAETCKRVIVMYLGQIVEEGLVNDIFDHPAHPYTTGLMDSIPKLDSKKGERLSSDQGNRSIIKHIPRCRLRQDVLMQRTNVMRKCLSWCRSVRLRRCGATGQWLIQRKNFKDQGGEDMMGMTERPIVLQGTGVRKYFPVHTGFGKPKKYVKAVDGVDITIHEGEIYGLVGETGCGKSTLGRTLIRLTDPTDGNISVLGKDITKLNDKQMTGYAPEDPDVFQDPYTSLDPKQKVGDTSWKLWKPCLAAKKDRLDIAMEIMGKVGLRPEHFYRYPHEFSGGQRQRVGLARALILNPKVIVCDEPVSALDVSIQAQIINLLQDLREKDNISFLFIAHDMSVVKYISDRIGVMYLGHLMEEAETEELFANPLHPYAQALLSAVPTRIPMSKRREWFYRVIFHHR